MSLNTVTVTFNVANLIEAGQRVTVSLTPSATVIDATDSMTIGNLQYAVLSATGTGSIAGVVATDNSNTSPAGWGYDVDCRINGVSLEGFPFLTLIPYASGATQDISSLIPVTSLSAGIQYMPLPTGTATAGYVPLVTENGQPYTEWGTPPGGSPSGTAGGDLSGSYPDPTVAQVGGQALPLPLTLGGTGEDASSAGALLTALGVGTAGLKAVSYFLQVANNLSDVASASTARTNLGLGTAATQNTGVFLQVANNLSDVNSASTARTNLGLGSAALLASSAVAQTANNLSDLASASTARTNLGLGSAATQNSSAFDTSGAAATAQANAEAASLALTGGTMSGAIAMGSHKVTGLTNGSASSDAAAFGQVPVVDSLASDIQPAGQSAAAGGNGKWSDSGHIHPPGSGFLCTPSQYGSGTQSVLQIQSTTLAPISTLNTTVASGSNGGEISNVASWSSPSAGVLDVASTSGFPTSGTNTLTVIASGSTTAVITYTGVSGNSFTGCAYVSGSASGTVATGALVVLNAAEPSTLSTGSFTAPPSGEVIVTVTFSAVTGTASQQLAVALATHGTTTVVGYAAAFEISSTGTVLPLTIPFLVTGLSNGSSYNFDLLGSAQAGFSWSILAIASQSPALTSGGRGSPVLMTVEAI